MNLLYPKIAIALVLLYAAVEGFDRYGMYTLLRIGVCIISSFTAYRYYLLQKNQIYVWAFTIVAIIFNPVIEIHFNRNEWKDIDFIVAIMLGVSAYFDKKEADSKKLPPEVRAVFDRMFSGMDRANIATGVQETVANPMAQDKDSGRIIFGDVAENLLNARNMDMILLGYQKDFDALPKEVQDENKEHFEATINALKELLPAQIDNLLALREKSHNDLQELFETVSKRDKEYQKNFIEDMMRRVEENEGK